ncbi:alpha-protein kinase 3 isoform X2 [Antennarius striatus]|uniref:alpha-protein kinase 3 isoform X2 n=1 Tax=Antennarius striatus TaxID=241820 RepID=UPI0035B13964
MTMTSRRPMTRTYSGSGRTSSFNEEESSSSNGRTESRNTYLSDVRPENRSTLCTVMAQLTEDIQPCFETTLKSKAVSENCNVKFTCVVSGYPAPELKWYKDDIEMDRYCGLPKYEIRRNGKVHTLHIYNCTVDDAAIYQVSASNSKGIVSCSGVLEVGTMNEFQIHQRFFAKLKQNAEKKKKDLEAKKENKENTEKDKKQISPERPPRKRHVPPLEKTPAVDQLEAVEKMGAISEPNGVGNEKTETAPVTAEDGELDGETSPSEETLAEKKMKMSNGIDADINGSSSSYSCRSNMMGNGGENMYDGGFSLAQFLAETLQSQAAEEKQNCLQGEIPKEMELPVIKASIVQDGEQERMRKEKEQEELLQEELERGRRREKEIGMKKERERSSHRLPHTKYGSEAKHHSKTHKDHDHHHIQASISSMLHTVKDFLFGKSKKEAHDHIENREKSSDRTPPSKQRPQPELPPSFQLHLEYNAESKPLTDNVVPMEIDTTKEPSETTHTEDQPASLEQHTLQDTVLPPECIEKSVLPPESTDKSTEQSVKEEDGAGEVMEVSAGPESSGPGENISLSGLQVLSEGDSQVVSVIEEASMQLQPDLLAASLHPKNQAERYESSPSEDLSALSQTQAPCGEVSSPTPTFFILENKQTPPHSAMSTSHISSFGEEPNEFLKEGEVSMEAMDRESELHRQESQSSNTCEEEKAEVKSCEQLHTDVPRGETPELTSPLEKRIETHESTAPNQMLLPLSAVAVYSTEKDNMTQDTEHISLIQEMNVGFPPTVASKSLQKVDLKMQKEHTSSIAEERKEVHSLSPIQNLNSGFKCNEDKNEWTEVLISALEDNSCNEQKTQRLESLERESTEVCKENVKFEIQKEMKDSMKEEFDELSNISLIQNMKSHANGMEDTQQQRNSELKVWPSDNVPQIQICTIEDMPDIKPVLPDVSQNEHFILPKIDIMEPEVKEYTLPQPFLALNKQESAVLQKHDATYVAAVIIQDKHGVDSPQVPPMHIDVQNDFNLSSTKNIKDVDKILEHVHVQSKEELLQMGLSTIPLINVSCTDDKGTDLNVNDHISDMSQPFENPAAPLFVVPPISVTCHDSDSELRLSSHNESTGTETSSLMERGTKYDVENNMTIKPEKAQSRKQNLEGLAEKILKDSVPPMLCDVLMPKVGESEPSFSKTTQDSICPEMKTKSLNETKIENSLSVEDPQRNRSSVDRLCSKPPAHPSLSPASLRKFMSKASLDSDSEAATTVPFITVGDRQSDKADDDLSGGSTPTSSLSRESSPRLKRRDSLSLIRSATPEELASGARRKIFILKPKEEGEGAVVGGTDAQGKKETPYMSPSQARRAALLQAPTGQSTPPLEKRSPLLSRRKVTLEVPKVMEESLKEEPGSTKQEEKPMEKKLDPLKAPQVIRKIRGEPFPDASGHLKLWCQFFNVLSDSTIKWYRDEEEILEVKRRGGDESQVALAIVLACGQDCGVYGCSISNEHGTDTTDYLLSIDVMSGILLRDDMEVGEEIEMTPLLFTKGLADCGSWGDKYFGRIMTDTVQIGEGCTHKASRVRVIYGLDPIFESGSACIIKVRNPIAYGTKEENNLADRNREITKQECKVQNMIREYCKIFAAEARVTENFGNSLEVIPQYVMYRPANSVPYATVEADLKGDFLQYCVIDPKGRLITQTASEMEQKCNTFQHWIHQWTHGNLLVTRMEGVENKITNVRVATKSQGYQGLTERGSPEVFEQFPTQHNCNYFCGLLSLRPIKSMDSLQHPTKTKGSRSPLATRKMGSSSPQTQRKGHSPQVLRKANSSPKVIKKILETEDNKSNDKIKPAESVDVLEIR